MRKHHLTHLCILVLGISASPHLLAGFPVIDAPDLVHDLAELKVELKRTITELDTQLQLVQQYTHWLDQARKFTDRDQFTLSKLRFLAQAPLAERFFMPEPAVHQLLNCLDGLHDLASQPGRLQAAVDQLFPAVHISLNQTGAFHLGPAIRKEGTHLTGQLNLTRALLGHQLSWASESQFEMETDDDTLRLAQALFVAAEADEDRRGRQLGYDLINTDLYAVRMLLERKQHLLRAQSQSRALTQAFAQEDQRRRHALLEASLTRISTDSQQFVPASGHELRIP